MRLLSPLCLVAALSLAAPALADTHAPLITVTGTGTVNAPPDIATLMIGVTTQADTAAAALAANSTALDGVLARLTTAGIAQRDMQTSSLSINPNWTGYDSSAPVISGFVASNQLTVTVRDLSILGNVLDAAVQDGANTLNGLTFAVADPSPLLDDARRAAVADARLKAELLAEAAGVTLGPITSISETTVSDGPGPMFRAEMSAAVPVMTGEVGMSASVTINYEIAR